MLPAQTLTQCYAADGVALREYEYTVTEWLEAIRCGAGLDGVAGLAWRAQCGSVIENAPRAPVHDLDDLPFVTEVYKRFLNIRDYFYSHSPHPIVVFDTSRGCPYRCNFCAYPQTFSGHQMRYRSVANVVEEFRYAQAAFPALKSVMLEDDTFILDTHRAAEIGEALIASGNKLKISANCRPDIEVDLPLLQNLRRAGFRLFCVGFDSAARDVLVSISRNGDPHQARTYTASADRFTENCRKAGIMIHGCFMFGHLDDTKDTMKQTLDWALRLKLDTAQFFPLMIYPGTAAYQTAKRRGWIVTENYSSG